MKLQNKKEEKKFNTSPTIHQVCTLVASSKEQTQFFCSCNTLPQACNLVSLCIFGSHTSAACLIVPLLLPLATIKGREVGK
jgi:hypothetical protein